MLRTLLAALFLLSAPTWAAESAPPDYRFHFEVLAENLPQPMTMQEAPDGRIFFHEIAGKVKVFDPQTKLVSEVGEITVTTAQENGLLGMALDPDFAKNGWIYLMHSPPDFDGQYISRFTLKDGKLDPASRKDLLNWPEQREQCCHHAGALHPEVLAPVVETGAKVVPVAVDGRELGRRWRVVVGEALEPAVHPGPLAVADLAEQARAAVQHLLDRL